MFIRKIFRNFCLNIATDKDLRSNVVHAFDIVSKQSTYKIASLAPIIITFVGDNSKLELDDLAPPYE